VLIKLLIIAAVILGVLYLVLPKRRAHAAPAPANRLALTLLATAGVVLFILSLFCALLWLGGISDTVTGAGDVLGGTGLLRIAGVLLALSLACGVIVVFKRR